MKTKRILGITLGLVVTILLVAAGYFLLRPLTVVIDGQPIQVQGAALTLGHLLRISGIPVGPQDRVSPPVNTSRFLAPRIEIERAFQVLILVDGKVLSSLTVERSPEKMMGLVGVQLNEGDELWLNGQPVNLKGPLPPAASYTFQVRRAVPLAVVEDGVKREVFSAGATVGLALWQAGIRLNPEDAVSPDPAVPLTQPMEVTIRHAVPLKIALKDRIISISSSAVTVAEALAQGGVSLQGMDYSLPAAGSPLPPDRTIRVVRVRDEVVLAQTTIPFESELKEDPNTELDQRSVLDPGEEGLLVSRVHVRYEDDKEVSRQAEGEWLARSPRNKVVGYGTKVVIHTLDTGAGVITYWRVITAYATSYSPCRQGYSYCSTGTASGMKLQKGVIGTSKRWFSFMQGQPLYVVGYGRGVVGDYGAGIPGRYFFDLGYGEEDYVGWHDWTTVYFLTPVPAYIPWILQ